MRTLAIGDVHGCLTALETLLSLVAPSSDDRVVFLGDYVDRGQDSRGVIKRILGLQEHANVTTLRGNHELLMLEARDFPAREESWRNLGGEATLLSYGGNLSEVPARHWEFLEWDCRSLWQSDTHFFVHANVICHCAFAVEQTAGKRHLLGALRPSGAALLRQNHGLRPHAATQRQARKPRPRRLFGHQCVRRRLPVVFAR